MNRRYGFTLIELLVVIAIIGILSAIIFPVFARAKDSAYRNSDMSNMNQIRTALQLYKADQGAYPPALLGYATTYVGNVPNAQDVVPANQVVGALYPKRVSSLDTLRPAYDRATAGSENTSFTTAAWPVGFPAGASPTGGNVQRCYVPTDGNPPFAGDALYYTLSGYDAALIKTANGLKIELHYTRFWSSLSVPVDACQDVDGNPNLTGTGSAGDDPRQLGYTDPPETTVVTWDSFFRDYDGNNVATHTKRDIVLFLGGTARPMDSWNVSQQAWKVTP